MLLKQQIECKKDTFCNFCLSKSHIQYPQGYNVLIVSVLFVSTVNQEFLFPSLDKITHQNHYLDTCDNQEQRWCEVFYFDVV